MELFKGLNLILLKINGLRFRLADSIHQTVTKMC